MWIEALYLENGPALLSYLHQRLGDVSSAEDLLQETFVAVLRHPERLRSSASPRAYLFGIARNLAASSCRNLRAGEPLTPEVSEATAISDPRLERMRASIDRLKPEFREVLQMRLQHEFSYEEIATVLGVPIGTVRSRLHHAVLQLQRALTRTPTIQN